MAVVKVENKTYTAGSLYQWDKNQVLEIRGLSLASIPEIHFTNPAMSRAIVRQASMDDAGIITVDVPNSMLQSSGKMTVYICTYEGSTFQTLYKLEIMVKARPKPADYTLVDDPEVYSFNALENQIVNAMTKVDAAAEKYEAAAGKESTALETYATAAEELNAAAQNYQQAVDNLTEAAETLEAAAAKLAAAEEIMGNLDTGVYLPLAGGTMTGPVEMGGQKITGLPTPTDSTEPVTLGHITPVKVYQDDGNHTPASSYEIPVENPCRFYVMWFYDGVSGYVSYTPVFLAAPITGDGTTLQDIRVQTSETTAVRRDITVYENKIVVAAAYVAGTTTVADTKYLVPHRVYGFN